MHHSHHSTLLTITRKTFTCTGSQVSLLLCKVSVPRVPFRGTHKVVTLRMEGPSQDIPDFTSSIYTYHGTDGELAPRDVTEVIMVSL